MYASKLQWLQQYFTFSEISLIRPVMVFAKKLISENSFIFSKHTVSTTVFHLLLLIVLLASKSNIFQFSGLPLKYKTLQFQGGSKLTKFVFLLFDL